MKNQSVTGGRGRGACTGRGGARKGSRDDLRHGPPGWRLGGRLGRATGLNHQGSLSVKLQAFQHSEGWRDGEGRTVRPTGSGRRSCERPVKSL